MEALSGNQPELIAPKVDQAPRQASAETTQAGTTHEMDYT